jgi:hypothetical protein
VGRGIVSVTYAGCKEDSNSDSRDRRGDIARFMPIGIVNVVFLAVNTTNFQTNQFNITVLTLVLFNVCYMLRFMFGSSSDDKGRGTVKMKTSLFRI